MTARGFETFLKKQGHANFGHETLAFRCGCASKTGAQNETQMEHGLKPAVQFLV